MSKRARAKVWGGPGEFIIRVYNADDGAVFYSRHDNPERAAGEAGVAFLTGEGFLNTWESIWGAPPGPPAFEFEVNEHGEVFEKGGEKVFDIWQ